MAHVKAGSSRAHQKANVVGKRRGLKVNQGQTVRGGQILVRQTGIVYKAGMNTKLSRDSSVVSRVAGVVQFSYLRRPNGLRTVVNVWPKVEAPKSEKKVVAKKVAPKKRVTKVETKTEEKA
ncbi:MAG: 50S ribosomal protein L27 [Candidatus Dojkabacteria bacterium]|nr:MAG: 50S ribosomal protein L27 [Candidatus Dojkabacteria bacterium]